ncbi:hypothetical protein HDU76_008011, partial [Blyttiomyces sp. JEL0837]
MLKTKDESGASKDMDEDIKKRLQNGEMWYHPPDPVVELRKEIMESGQCPSTSFFYQRSCLLWLPYIPFGESMVLCKCGNSFRLSNPEVIKEMPREVQDLFPCFLSKRGGLDNEIMRLLEFGDDNALGVSYWGVVPSIGFLRAMHNQQIEVKRGWMDLENQPFKSFQQEKRPLKPSIVLDEVLSFLDSINEMVPIGLDTEWQVGFRRIPVNNINNNSTSIINNPTTNSDNNTSTTGYDGLDSTSTNSDQSVPAANGNYPSSSNNQSTTANTSTTTEIDHDRILSDEFPFLNVDGLAELGRASKPSRQRNQTNPQTNPQPPLEPHQPPTNPQPQPQLQTNPQLSNVQTASEEIQQERWTSYKDGNVCLIQLAFSKPYNRIILFQFQKSDKLPDFPEKLLRILQHKNALFVGRSIKSMDAKHLEADWGVHLANVVALEDFCFDKEWVESRQFSLDDLTRAVLRSSLDKDPKLRVSDWSTKLTPNQVLYAARDCWASLQIYRKVLTCPKPPQPISKCNGKVEVMVKCDGLHCITRLTSECTGEKTNPLVPSFAAALRDAIYTFDDNIRSDIDKVLREKSKDAEVPVTFESMLASNPDYILLRCPRKVEGPDILLPKIQRVEQTFSQAKYKNPNGTPFLNENVKKAFKNLYVHVKKGCLSDPPGLKLYYECGKDKDGLNLYRCVRGSSRMESYCDTLSVYEVNMALTRS